MHGPLQVQTSTCFGLSRGHRPDFFGAVGGGFFVEMLTAIFAKAHYWPFPLPPLKLQKAEKELLSGTENTSKNPLV